MIHTERGKAFCYIDVMNGYRVLHPVYKSYMLTNVPHPYVIILQDRHYLIDILLWDIISLPPVMPRICILPAVVHHVHHNNGFAVYKSHVMIISK